jgi:hypothetical protein
MKDAAVPATVATALCRRAAMGNDARTPRHSDAATTLIS